MSKAAIITGEPNDTSRLNGILDYASKYLEEKKVSFETIHVHDLPAEDLIKARFDSEAIIQAAEVVKKSSGVLILTPVYKASYSGILKTFLDLLPQKGLEGKTILPLAIGGSYAHLLMIEYALRPVLSVLGANQFVNAVYTLDQQIERTEGNQFFIHDELQERLKTSLDTFAGLIKNDRPLQLK
ncbi:NADPH-dependent FMN reductase [Bacillus massiliglaciei]|uniref:NADPH-dependent FMN reductase n=1 Tax=Bacillus massiliglaciei TaxID=1816693 RepID=UPI000ACB2785|nr:NADPH-dependent FMN reductase [Bacillus massiliglaciei]